MARPAKKGLDYFPHDTDAFSDMKMQSLLTLCGLSGIGFYWYIIERIYREDTFMLDVSDAETIQILCRNMAITTQEYNKYSDICLKYGLFNRQIYDKNGKLSSDGVMKRANAVVAKRKREKNKYDKLMGHDVSDAETPQEYGGNPVETRQRKGK